MILDNSWDPLWCMLRKPLGEEVCSCIRARDFPEGTGSPSPASLCFLRQQRPFLCHSIVCWQLIPRNANQERRGLQFWSARQGSLVISDGLQGLWVLPCCSEVRLVWSKPEWTAPHCARVCSRHWRCQAANQGVVVIRFCLQWRNAESNKSAKNKPALNYKGAPDRLYFLCGKILR